MKRSCSAGFVSVSVVINIIFGLVIVGVSGFAIWAFMSYQDYKNNVDAKVAVAVKNGKDTQQKEDQAAFAEQEKSPTRKLMGPAELGSVSVDYPKTWSVYLDQSGSGGQFEAYMYPGAVPSLQTRVAYALRVSVVNSSYETVVANMQQQVKDGTLKASVVKVTDGDGVRLDGKFGENIQGSMVLFKVRDKTLRVFTESIVYQSDFDKIIVPSLKFNK